MDIYNEMMTGLDEVEEDHGQTGEPLPKGRYPTRIENIPDSYQTDNGAIMIRLMLKVNEGAHVGETTFVSIHIAPSHVNYNPDTKEKTLRSDEEMLAIAKRLKKKNKGWVKSIDVEFGEREGETPLDQMCAYYNVNEWIGKDFMASLRVSTSNQGNQRNELAAFHSYNDAKYGLEEWRLKEGAGGQATAGAGKARTLDI